MDWKRDAALDWRIRHIELPIREIPEAELEAALQLLEKHPRPYFNEGDASQVHGDWMHAALLKSVHIERQRAPTLRYEVQVLRIGDAAIVGLPGEPFAEGGLSIKLASPAAQTYIAHATSHYAGYIPTEEAFARGGHEVNLSWAKLAPASLDRIIETATELLHEVFAG